MYTCVGVCMPAHLELPGVAVPASGRWLTGGAVGGAAWVPVGVIACWMAAANAFDNTHPLILLQVSVPSGWFIQLVICCYSSDCLNRTMTTSTGRHVDMSCEHHVSIEITQCDITT